MNKEALFAAKYGPDWKVSIDADSNLPRRMVGSSIELTGVPEGAEPEVRKFIADNSQVFSLDSAELELIKEDHDPSLYGKGSGISNLVYRQSYKGIPVYSSRVGATVNDGKLVAVDSSYFPDITAPTEASIDEMQALSAAGRDLGIDIAAPVTPLSSVSLDEFSRPGFGPASEKNVTKAEQVSLVIYPVENEGGYEYHLAYEIELALLKEPLSAWVYFVDANDGQVLYRYDRMIPLSINGNVTGTVYPECPADTPINVPFRNQIVSVFNESNKVLFSERFNDATGYAVTSNPIDLTGAVNSRLNFSTRYDIESEYDYAHAAISEDGNLFYFIGNFTGSQDSWTDESIDISNYDGKQVWIGFFYVTDEYVLGEGFYADNITVSSDNGVVFADDLENGDENWDFNIFSLKLMGFNPITTTDGNGYYNITGLEEDFYIYSEFSGPYVKVINEDKTNTFVEFNLSSPTHDWDWTDLDTSYEREESNVFYHVNVIHDYFTKGSPFDIHSMDYQATATVEYGSETGNAFSDGTDIYLYAAGNGYESTAVLSDVIYHEYTHSVVDHVYYPTDLPYIGESGALNEGWADYFACTINNNSIVAEGFYVSSGSGLRNINNTYRYPDDMSDPPEVHADSRIISGTMWDLRELLGAELADELILRGMKLEPQDFREYLEDILIVDDDNADLSDGTPHINAICKAFYVNHGIDTEFFDSVAPEVSGKSPFGGSYISSNTTPIAANITYLIDVDPSSICMTVSGEAAAVTKTEINKGYRVKNTPSVPYGDGEVTVCLNASDAADNYVSHTWSFFVDTKSPLSNTPDDTEFSANSTTYFTGWKLFDLYPGYYRVLCDGEEIVPPAQWANDTQLSIPVNTDIGIGDFNYTIQYNDTVGNYGEQDTVIITIDFFPAPKINISSPVDGYSTTSGSVTVSGTVNGTGSLPSVTVNGVDADLFLEGFNGTFSQTVPLSLGINTISANATDARGSTNKTFINVTRTSLSTDSGGSSGSSSGSSGGGGGGGSPEPASNVEIKELSQQFVTNGNRIRFAFTQEVTPVVYVEFDARRSFGKTTTIIEELKGKSFLTPAEPDGDVYKHLNIWVGNGGVATPENIDNPVIGFRVEKSWLEINDISESSIKLWRYNDDVWNLLPPEKVNEDDEYVYFEAETPGFSPFAITGGTQEEPGVEVSSLEIFPMKNQTDASVEPRGQSESGEDVEQPESGEGNVAGLDFKFVVGLLACAFLLVRRRS